MNVLKSYHTSYTMSIIFYVPVPHVRTPKEGLVHRMETIDIVQ